MSTKDLYSHDYGAESATGAECLKCGHQCEDPWTDNGGCPVMSWTEFEEEYGPLPPSSVIYGSPDDVMVDTGKLDMLRKKYSQLRIWTMVECENDTYDADDANSETNSPSHWYLSPGIHFVNRLGYVVSTKPWHGDTPDVLYD